MSSFYTSDVTSISGSYSLKVDVVDKIGGAITKSVAGLSKFTMKAYIYDSMCEGTHWISPDYQTCLPIANAKSMLPSLKTGAGINTASAPDVYTTTYPWHSSPAERSQGWHSLTFRDDDTTLDITVDEYSDMPLRSSDVSTDISKVFLRSVRTPDQMIASGSSVYWDAILVTEYDPSVSAASMAEETVTYAPTAAWSTVGTTNPPPARQAHTAVVYDDAMYIFGGERSAYEYSDLWAYTFGTDTWAFQPTTNSSSELGRHDHTAVVYGDSMFVYGGRSPEPLADFWEYSFATKSWMLLPSSAGMAARFGHTAAVVGDMMFVYGGYTEGELTDEIWAYDFTTMEWTKVGPRYDNFAADYIKSPTDAIIFPMEIPKAVFSQAMVTTGKDAALYAIGGAGGEFMMDEMPSLWKFDVDSLEWEWMMTDPLLARYDSSAVLFGDYALVYGGHSGGAFLGDMFVIFLGETGL
jgi:N-acetylneuraminic acid mutarotase